VNDDARRRHDQMRKAAGGKGKPPPKKAPARAVVAHACGHKVGLAQLESQDCPACVGARRRAHNRERYDSVGLPRGEKFRLPVGTKLVGEYVAEGKWYAHFEFVDAAGHARTFSAEMPAVHDLIREIGKMAWEWLKAREGGAK
jgi:hypothetical protein